MLPSGNDAAFLLAQYFGQLLFEDRYTDDEVDRIHSYEFNRHELFVKYFLREMNDNAAKLGLINTSFDSPHGLANMYNLSTAQDMCKLAMYCMKLDAMRTIVGSVDYECDAYMTYNNGNIDYNSKRRYKWINTNKLLHEPGYNGLKTGITLPAGPCLAASYENKGHHFVVVILNAKS
mmetsp:Transcript_22379/g.15944  ORF Transcript_22379/g.15944 Transcript_22379/m.15944 type:complete len:177 (-) Transcript_22379:274-804(-)